MCRRPGAETASNVRMRANRRANISVSRRLLPRRRGGPERTAPAQATPPAFEVVEAGGSSSNRGRRNGPIRPAGRVQRGEPRRSAAMAAAKASRRPPSNGRENVGRYLKSEVGGEVEGMTQELPLLENQTPGKAEALEIGHFGRVGRDRWARRGRPSRPSLPRSSSPNVSRL